MALSKLNIQKLVSQNTRGRYAFQPLWVSDAKRDRKCVNCKYTNIKCLRTGVYTKARVHHHGFLTKVVLTLVSFLSGYYGGGGGGGYRSLLNIIFKETGQIMARIEL